MIQQTDGRPSWAFTLASNGHGDIDFHTDSTVQAESWRMAVGQERWCYENAWERSRCVSTIHTNRQGD